jgi:glycosyltransferase involved in cell wall biosynthesis
MGIGGIETGSRDISKYLNKKKIENYILCERSKNNIRDKSLNIIYLDNLKFKNIFDQYKIRSSLKKIILNKNINLVHISSRAPAFFLIKFLKKLNIKVVTSVHNKYKPGFLLKDWYNGFLLKGDSVIFNSNFVKNTYIKKYSDKSKLFVIPRGIDTDYFQPLSSNKKDNIQKILLPSRISSWKGHDNLLSFYKRKEFNLRDKFKLVFISSHQSKYEKRIDMLIKNLNLSKFVLFKKPTLDIKKLYEDSFIIINCSTRPEGFGRTISEALSMKKPVIAPNMGGTKEQLLKFDKKLLFDVDSYSSFVRSFKYVNDNYAIIVKKSRNFVVENFSSEKMCKETLEIYLRNLN